MSTPQDPDDRIAEIGLTGISVTGISLAPLRPHLVRGAGLGLLAGSANGAGAYFLIEVYRHVLPQKSGQLLFVLALALAVIFAVQAALRSRAIRHFDRAGLAFLAEWEPAFLKEAAEKARAGASPAEATARLVLLFDIATLLRGRAPLALVELLWTPPFLLILAAVDLRLGGFALAMAGLAVGLPLYLGRNRPRQRKALSAQRRALEDALLVPGPRDSADLAVALSSLRQQDREADSAARMPGLDLVNTLAMLRELAFVGILTIGATLVLTGAIGIGALMASGMLMMRIFVPLQAAISYQPEVSAAIRAWKTLQQGTFGKHREGAGS